jgi:hypothetical protein
VVHPTDGTVIVGCGDNSIKYFNDHGEMIDQTKVDGRVLGLSLAADALEVRTNDLHPTEITTFHMSNIPLNPSRACSC